MSVNTVKPKLIAFDLDFTLWPYWVDTHVDFPVQKRLSLSGSKVVDAHGKKVKWYHDVPDVLKKLKSQGYILAVASRTSEIEGANQLMSMFDWDKYFTYKEIYPGCKVNHFKRFQELSKLPFSEMLFFDDEMRNKRDLEKIGVLTFFVTDGVDSNVVKDGLQMYDNIHCGY